MTQLEIDFEQYTPFPIGMLIPMLNQNGETELWQIVENKWQPFNFVMDGDSQQDHHWWYRLESHTPYNRYSRWTMRHDSIIEARKKANAATILQIQNAQVFSGNTTQI